MCFGPLAYIFDCNLLKFPCARQHISCIQRLTFCTPGSYTATHFGFLACARVPLAAGTCSRIAGFGEVFCKGACSPWRGKGVRVGSRVRRGFQLELAEDGASKATSSHAYIRARGEHEQRVRQRGASFLRRRRFCNSDLDGISPITLPPSVLRVHGRTLNDDCIGDSYCDNFRCSKLPGPPITQ